MLITNSADVADFCARAAQSKFVTVDTEFVREKTYWPILCLIQIATRDEAVAIDPLADGIDLGPVYDLMKNTDVLKVLHSASQDMQIMFTASGAMVEPVFDTQIAAMVSGYGDQPAYATLVQRIVGETIDKRSQMTDWSRRPLTDRQVDYAIGDVTYLIDVYDKLSEELEEADRESWAHEEMRHLRDQGLYESNPRELWRKVRLRRPTRRALAVLREITAWRELSAQRRNIPKGWVCRDEALAEIALNTPETPAALERVRGVNERFAHGRDGKALLEAVQVGLDVPDDECPDPEKGRPPLRGHETLVALLQALLKLRSDENGVAAQLIANRKELDRIATEEEPDVRTLSGWRREIYGNDAIALKRGEIALTADGLSVRVVTA
ncbi:ribonuclease D [Candidatus Lucifugimonas marina]|uniref:Ribonuclease D n=1 Tax=Candidatus Lucifugimonas marina TaxID=3038979 RepID=A0AAJ6CW96_9CHLR|nr:ribonuclease D [SAR202 cluster bacterium JH702]WFG36822.1 ribonuclease D [SAR202 cluster bacterium JH545]WFG40760.1 ribonuclease D [SAR202 cluster bacterium JH1073]